jgi:hypothetical protein
MALPGAHARDTAPLCEVTLFVLRGSDHGQPFRPKPFDSAAVHAKLALVSAGRQSMK